MNIIVTGGAGFIGSHFVKKVNKERPDYRILVLDKLTYAGNMKNLDGTDCQMHLFDIADPAVENEINIFEPDVIVNFAAETHVDRSIKDPKAFLETDIMGIFNLISICRKYGKLKHFIHISTDEIYGSLDHWASAITFKTDSPLNPTSPYSASKAAADLLLLSYQKTYNFPVTIIRPCNNYGPNQYPEKLIPMTITRLLKGEKVIVHGKGMEKRQWIYVEDCADMIYKKMIKPTGGIVNLGSPDLFCNIDVIRRIAEYIDNDIKNELDFQDRCVFLPNRPGNDQEYCVEEIFEYEYLRFNDGLIRTINWYEKNSNWWKNVDISANLYTEEEGYFR